MKEINLTAPQAALLRGIVGRRVPEMHQVVETLGARVLTGPEKEALQEALATELVEFELVDGCEPTPRGVAIDDLIDVISRF